MRIAMLTNNYRPFVGGVPISVERQAVELAKRGNDVTVFAPKYEQTEDPAEEELYKEECRGRLHIVRFSTGKHCLENGMAIPRLVPGEILPVFEEEEFDLIHTHHPMFVGPMALHLGRKYHLPVVYTYHTRYEDYLHYLPLFQREKNGIFGESIYRVAKEKMVPGYMRWFTNQCSLVLAPSAGMQKRMKKNGTRVPTAVFPTGLKEGFYREFPEEAKKIRQRFLPEGGVLFCTAGRLEKEKNPEFLFRGIRQLKEQMDQTFRVLVIGTGSMEGELRERARQLNIQDEICFLGNVPNMELSRYLQAGDVFLFASKSETQGIVLVEAMAAGCPVVAVQASGVEDLVKNGVNGFMTEEDVFAWVEKVQEVAEKSDRLSMKRRAKQTADGYRADRLAQYEELLYEQCILAGNTRTGMENREGTEYIV